MSVERQIIDELESYQRAKKSATNFSISVSTTGGEKITSSPIPIDSYTMITSEIIESMYTSAPISVWNRVTNSLTVVPASQIRTVAFVFD